MLASCDKDNRCIRGDGSTITQTRTATGFHNIDLNGSYDVLISQDSVYSLTIEGEGNVLERITTEVLDGTLKIDSKGCIKSHRAIKIRISMPDLQMVELNGSGDIRSNNTFVVNSDVFLVINGSGDMDFKIKTPKMLETRINGSGDIIIAGEADKQLLNITGSGDIHSFDLSAKTGEIKVDGSGNSEVNIAETMDVRITGSGNVIYIGTPSMEVNISGSGTVRRK